MTSSVLAIALPCLAADTEKLTVVDQIVAKVNGYIVSQADDWEHDWAWWANYLKAKGMQLGVYYNPLWATKSALEYYDIVILACEGGEANQTKPTAAKQAMHDWLNEGGKVFATHFHYTWFKNSPAADFQNVATWLGSSAGTGAPRVPQTTRPCVAMASPPTASSLGRKSGRTLAAPFHQVSWLPGASTLVPGKASSQARSGCTSR